MKLASMNMCVIFPGYALRNLKQISTIINIFLTPGVQKVDSAIHRINHYPLDSALLVSLILMRWIVIYPVNTTIQLLNNWDLKYTSLSKTQEHGLFCYAMIYLQTFVQV